MVLALLQPHQVLLEAVSNSLSHRLEAIYLVPPALLLLDLPTVQLLGPPILQLLVLQVHLHLEPLPLLLVLLALLLLGPAVPQLLGPAALQLSVQQAQILLEIQQLVLVHQLPLSDLGEDSVRQAPLCLAHRAHLHLMLPPLHPLVQQALHHLVPLPHQHLVQQVLLLLVLLAHHPSALDLLQLLASHSQPLSLGIAHLRPLHLLLAHKALHLVLRLLHHLLVAVLDSHLFRLSVEEVELLLTHPHQRQMLLLVKLLESWSQYLP